MRLAGQADVDRLEAPGGAEQQTGSIDVSALVRGNLTAQSLYLRICQRIQRSGLDHDQQAQRLIQRPRITLGSCRGDQPLRPASRFGRQQRRVLQERRRGQAAAGLGPARRPLQLRGDVLIRSRRRLSPVPGSLVRVDSGIGGLRQCGVDFLPGRHRGRPVGRRAHQRVPEPHPRAELRQPRPRRRPRRLQADSEPPGGPPY